ncbi:MULTISPECIES: acetoacetate--CoA ligase [Nitrospirillum]|uniref:Acetoacetyl-CoA synthetase n=1 Tax=Nitrospirillum amazonense TaxID=28077 RepID=A0A560GDY4_9PROT|nr:acetoacetate--CoA ligase [Nitrospirillum amazonense]MEC4590971.1 acetoacetate--CoA ligase [Nitrospirillum amazonense]TWB32116.1 acetoacetyl-CoA synthetase [Nitrospirillum amazonense]
MTNRGAGDSVPQIRLYREWLHRERGLTFPDYAAMWEWSRSDLAAFWLSVWDYHALESPTPPTVIVDGAMPDARWFAGAQVNYARQVFRHADLADAAGQPAIIAEGEGGQAIEWTWGQLRRRTASLALALRRGGIGRGDVVAAYLPNIPEAVVSMLACASLGAVWTMCSPDMGTPAVLDRLRQAAPKALIAVDGVFYGDRRMDRSATVEAIRRGLPTVASLFAIQTGHGAAHIRDSVDFDGAQSADDAEVAAFEPEWLPFDHPLWILYSSGTTGLPKAIVHGHGGIVVSACVGNMHLDLGPSYSLNTVGERFHWYSATGWVMWNIQVGGLLTGTTICLYDGSPKGAAGQSEWQPLWAFAARHGVTWFGAGAAFFASCRKAGLALNGIGDLRAIRALGSTGSPLTADVQDWGTAQFDAVGTPDIWWCNISGGTDIAAAFLSGNRELPPTPGRLQCRHLGASVEAWDEDGHALRGRVGELVCTRPFPSMPLFFWGDEDGSRYRSTYFDAWDGIWRHGDWLAVEADGSCVIAGRSDATINRHGLRMGTADIYAAVERLGSIADSLVIDLEDGAGDSKLLMFVVPGDGRAWGPDLEAAVVAAIRDTLSPRFIPDAFIPAPAIPRTLSGKKQELPIKRLFQGWPVAKVIDPNLTENPGVIPWYITQAEAWRERSGAAETKAGGDIARGDIG